MAGLVCYDSADSENEEISQSKCERNEVPGSGSSASAGAGDLEAEWESFEKLISGPSGEPAHPGGGSSLVEPSGVPCPSLATLSSSSPPFISHPKVAGAESYESSLRLQQNAYSCSYEPESLFERRTTSVSSAHDSDDDDDMDVCSNSSSNQKRSPQSRRPTTSSISSSAILAANDAANSSDLESGSESSKSARSSVKETSRKRFSEFKGSDEDKHVEKRVRRGSSSSESASHSDDDGDDDDNAINPAMMHEGSPSSDSDKSSAASPKMASSSSPPDLSPKKVIASDGTETSAKKTAEPKEASQDRLRSKLLALAEEKVRTSRSKSRDDRSKRHSRHSPSPSRHRGADHRSTDRHKKRRSSRSLSRERRRRTSRDGHGRRRHSRSPRRRSHRSRSRSHSRRHYRDRRDRRPSRRSRSHDRAGDKRRKSGGSRSPPRPKMNFKEQLKAQLMQVQKQTADDITQDIAVIENKPLVTANEKKSTLPLNNPNPLTAMVTGAKDKVTPQQALMQTMAAMHAKAQELTGVAVPSYYNPAAVNPLKYAEQLKKRKLLWSKNKETEKDHTTISNCTNSVESSKAQWTSTSFAADQDGKMAAKFRKLMGIKEEDKMLLLDNVDLSKLTEEQRQRQEELFMQLDREYAFARMTTHTHRGIGLGFQSQGLPDV